MIRISHLLHVQGVNSLTHWKKFLNNKQTFQFRVYCYQFMKKKWKSIKCFTLLLQTFQLNFILRQSSAWSYVIFNYDVTWRRNTQWDIKNLLHQWYPTNIEIHMFLKKYQYCWLILDFIISLNSHYPMSSLRDKFEMCKAQSFLQWHRWQICLGENGFWIFIRNENNISIIQYRILHSLKIYKNLKKSIFKYTEVIFIVRTWWNIL